MPTATRTTTPTPTPAVFFVSPDGNDGNPGTQARPFQTIQKARDAVRTSLAKGVEANLTVFLRGGRYFLSSPLLFTDADSPKDSHKVIYRNYGNEEPVIVGGRLVTGWERQPGNVYRANVGKEWKFYTLFENGVRSAAARTPNEGYAKVAAAVPAADMTQFVYATGDVPDDLPYSNAQVYIWAGHNWGPAVVPIAAIDRATRKITLAEATSYSINAGDRYFIQGSRDLIDRLGEFALGEADGYLYYWPRSGPIEQQEIIAPTVPTIIQVKGRSATALARNIVFQGLTLTVTDFAKTVKYYNDHDGAVHIENAEKVTVQFSKVRNTGGHGIVLKGYAQENVVYGNLLEDLGMNGVLLRGLAIGDAHVNKKNRVSNNYIRRGGQLYGSGSGVMLGNSGDNEISYNKITDMPRYGVSMKGITYGRMATSYKGIAVTWENHWDFIQTRNNLIQFNDISRVLLDSEDAGGIELYGAGKGNVIHNNRIHDFTVGAPRRDQSGIDAPGLTKGIYLDDASDYNRVTNNIIFGVTGRNASMVTMKGIYNEFSNNVVVNEAEEPPAVAGGAWSAHVMSQKFVDERTDNLRITRNIFVSARVSEMYRFYNWSDQRIAEADTNLFYHTSGSYFVGFTYDNRNRITLDEWRRTYGFDKNSAVGDPLFVDPAKRDYTVKPGSPALALGFVNVDQSKIGLQPDFPFARD